MMMYTSKVGRVFKAKPEDVIVDADGFAELKLKVDAVNHPAHYGGEDNPYEVIKVMEAWLTRDEFIGAMKFNIHKYLARALKKDGEEAYAKATWYSAYLNDYIGRHPAEDK